MIPDQQVRARSENAAYTANVILLGHGVAGSRAFSAELVLASHGETASLPGVTHKETHGPKDRSDRSIRKGQRCLARWLYAGAQRGRGQAAAADEQEAAPGLGLAIAQEEQEGLGPQHSTLLQQREAVALNTGDVVQGLPGTQPEPALVRSVPTEVHQGVVVGCVPPPIEANTKRTSSSADPRDGGSPSCSATEGGHHAPTPPKAGPLHQASGGLNTSTVSVLSVARGGHVPKDSNSAEASQWGVSPAALTQSGDHVQPSARDRGAKASGEQRPAGDSSPPVRRTDGVAPVAQPGSAPIPELPGSEVARSNRAGGSAEFAGGRSAERSEGRLWSSTPETKGIFAEVMLLGWSATVVLLGGRSAFNPRGAGSTPAGGATSLLGAVLADSRERPAHRARNSFDVGGDDSLIVLAESVRHEQPANVSSERQRSTRSRTRGVNGVGCARRSSSAPGVSTRAGLQRARVGAVVDIRCGGGGATPSAEVPVLRIGYARERDDWSSLADPGAVPGESTPRSAAIAQLEEHPPCKREVAGSSPAGGSTRAMQENESQAQRLSSGFQNRRSCGSNPTGLAHQKQAWAADRASGQHTGGAAARTAAPPVARACDRGMP